MNRKLKLILICTMVLGIKPFTFADPASANRNRDAYPGGYYNGDTLPEKTAYFTFDDGPTDWTSGILDELKKENVKATFFISAYWNNKRRTGNPAYRKYRKELLRIVREGHVIGNHTADHKILSRLSDGEIRDQLNRNQVLLDSVLGKETMQMKFVRPPLGYPWYKRSSIETKKRVGKVLAEKWLVALWTREADSTDSWKWVTGEWYRNSSKVNTESEAFRSKVKRIHDRIISRADGRGMIILMHDTHNTTLKALPSIIKDLKAKGYSFCTMDDYASWKYGTAK